MIIAPLTTAAVTIALAGALTLAPSDDASADAGATDRHEVPTFVLDRVELATGADGSGHSH
jgi:hypothetical protein